MNVCCSLAILLIWSAEGLAPFKTNGHTAKRMPAVPKVSPSTTTSSLETFVQMRSGLNPGEEAGDPIFWTCDGELYATPSGKILARIEGFETSRAVRLEANAYRIFSRKLVWFLDPETNEIVTDYEGKPVRPIRFDAQVLDIEQPPESGGANDSLAPIFPSVVRSTRQVPCMPITPRWGGSPDVLMFQVPLFIDIEIPIGGSKTRRYQAWEFYDYSMNVNDDNDYPPTLSWTRQGSTPPFCTDGTGVTHSRCHRVDTFEDMPQSTQDYVNQNDPLFREPPQSMEEVDRLLADN